MHITVQRLIDSEKWRRTTKEKRCDTSNYTHLRKN